MAVADQVDAIYYKTREWRQPTDGQPGRFSREAQPAEGQCPWSLARSASSSGGTVIRVCVPVTFIQTIFKKTKQFIECYCLSKTGSVQGDTKPDRCRTLKGTWLGLDITSMPWSQSICSRRPRFWQRSRCSMETFEKWHVTLSTFPGTM